MKSNSKLFILSVIIFFLVSGNILFSQNVKENAEASVKKLDFKVMPYISYDRNLEFMFGAIPLAMYRVSKNDTISPKSLSGLGGVYTTNKSFFIAGFTKLYLAEDRWRAYGYLYHGNLNSQVFIEDAQVPGFIDYNTVASVFSIGLQRKLYKNFYGGIGYSYADFGSIIENSEDTEESTIQNLEFSLLSDTRDNQYYPLSGHNTQIKWRTFSEWLGNEQESNKLLVSHNQYFSFRDKKDVLAARIHGEFGFGTILFEQQVVIGGKDIRGYSEAKYRGDGLLSLQGEYRWNFSDKMGLVGFAGAATIYGSQNSDFDWKLYPGAGLGYRYKAFKNNALNIGLDGAFGKGDWGLYFRIAEAF